MGEIDDPHAASLADAGRGNGRGPGWQRASASGGFSRRTPRPVEAGASAVTVGAKGRSDVSLGTRVFHTKFGYGNIVLIEGNKLEIDFDHAGRKRVLDSFIELV